MKRISFIFFAGFLLINIACKKHYDVSVSGDLWQKLNTPYFGKPLDIKFISADTGYILGAKYSGDSIYNILIKTFDGGQTWQSIAYTDHKFLTDTSGGTMNLIYVSPFNSNIIFSSGNLNLLRSTDGGLHWQRVDTINRQGGPLMYFSDPTNGVCAGGEQAAKTKDSGYNWIRTFFQQSFVFLNLLQFTSKQVGYIAGGFQFDGSDGGTLVKTTDGGNTWQTINYPFDDILSISFVNDNIGYISMLTETGGIGNTYVGSKFIKTLDGGNTWQLIAQTPNDNKSKDDTYTNLHFQSELEGFAINPKGIFHTIDGCKSWEKEYSGFMNFLCFPDEHTGYAMDTSGAVFKRVF